MATLQGVDLVEPEQTTDQPSLEDLEEILWINKDFLCTDGCWIERPLGRCEHGYATWFFILEIDPKNYGV